jgi:phosphoglycolate phosphatase
MEHRKPGMQPETSQSQLKEISHVFFDLDGTLMDPRTGIFNCFRYAFSRLGVDSPQESEMVSFIGPPLRVTFSRVLGTDNRDEIERAVAFYRERFSEVGLYENELYPDITRMLASLSKKPLALYLVTSKARVYAERIVEHFGLSLYFVRVYGPELDGTFDNKGELIGHILGLEGLHRGRVVMVGDRREDMLAARSNGVSGIGVAYGYGSRGELLSAGASRVFDTPSQLERALEEICMGRA